MFVKTKTRKTKNNFQILSLMMLGYLGLFSFAPTILAVTDDALVKQTVDNSVDDFCNENGVCEAELGETIETCPADCLVVTSADNRGGGMHPDVLQAIAEAPPIEIEVLDVEIVYEHGEVIISWRTNKPTDALLVLNEGTGETRNSYLDELYTIDHSAKIKNLNLEKKYYFKIFAKGIYGDNNYDYADLFAMGPFVFSDIQESVAGEEKYLTKKEEKKEYEVVKVDSQKLEPKLKQELENKIVPPSSDKAISQTSANWCSSLKNRVKTYLQKFHIIGESSLFSFGNEYKWQFTIFAGILYFVVLLRDDDKKRKQRKEK